HGEARFAALLRRLSDEEPAAALRSVYGRRAGRLDRDWRGTLEARPRGGVGQFLRSIAPYYRPHWRALLEILLYLTMSVGYGVGVARMQKTLVDVALVPRDGQALAVIMGALVVAFLIVTAVGLRRNYLVARTSQSVLRAIRLRIFDLLQGMHPGFFQTM